MKDTRSKELYERAKVHIPGGVNSPVRAFRAVNRTPRFMESAKGDRIIDADGNEYIDYVCSWGPGILGHAHPQVIKKVMDSCENGLTFGAPTEKEVILAELISELIPSMEVSRLVSSGTEAVMSAIRAARGFTGMRSEITTDLESIVRVVKENTSVPAAIGFGINTPEQAKKYAGMADGVIVGSAIVKIIEKYGENAAEPVYNYVKEMADAVKEA